MGGVNEDGEINVKDLVRLKKNIAAGQNTPSSDLNGDGTATAVDLTELKKILLG